LDILPPPHILFYYGNNVCAVLLCILKTDQSKNLCYVIYKLVFYF
jgi:hypothetical protein